MTRALRRVGAAAVDLRRFIGTAASTRAVVGRSPADLTPSTPVERDEGDTQVDAEGLWLQRELERVIARGGSRAALRHTLREVLPWLEAAGLSLVSTRINRSRPVDEGFFTVLARSELAIGAARRSPPP